MSTASVTPNIGLQIPATGSNNWQIPLNFNFNKLDQLLGGVIPIPNLTVENLTVTNFALNAADITNALGYQPLNPANNLSDVANAQLALNNLGAIGPTSVKGTWDSGTTYNLGDVVTESGNTYISLVPSNLSNDPASNPTFWVLFVGVGVSTVVSIFGRVGSVVAANGDYTAAQVTNALDLSNAGTQSIAGSLSVDGALIVDGISINLVNTNNLNLGGSIPSASTGSSNTAIGLATLASNTSGIENTAVGQLALNANSTGSHNTSVGYQASDANDTGNYNAALGWQALRANNGSFNVGVGAQALNANTTADDNAAFGTQSLFSTTTGSQNVGVGTNALLDNTTGFGNVAVGFDAGVNTSPNLLTISNSVFVGWGATSSTDGLTNMTVIGYGAVGTASNQMMFGNSSITANVFHGSISVPHLLGTGTAPTIAIQSHAGTGASCSLATGSTDTRGTITLNLTVTGSSAGEFARVTFATGYTAAPTVVICPNSAVIDGNLYVQSTTTGFSVYSNAANGSSVTLTLNYHVIG